MSFIRHRNIKMKVNEVIENREDVIASLAIGYIDDKLAQLSNEERYNEMGDMFRYILKILQNVQEKK